MSPQKKNHGGVLQLSITFCYLFLFLVTIMSSLNVVYSRNVIGHMEETTPKSSLGNDDDIGNKGTTKDNTANVVKPAAEPEWVPSKELMVQVINNNVQAIAELNQNDPNTLKKIAAIDGITVTPDKKTGKNLYSVKSEGKTIENLEKILDEINVFSTRMNVAGVTTLVGNP